MKVTLSFDITKEQQQAIAHKMRHRASGLAGNSTVRQFIDLVVLGALRDVCLDYSGEPVLPQKQVFKAVTDRGYTAGFLPEQILYRQFFKMSEELYEALQCMEPLGKAMARLDSSNPHEEKLADFHAYFTDLNMLAKALFDDADKAIYKMQPADCRKLQSELADMQVVLFCMAEALSDACLIETDVVNDAMAKSSDDVARGVRSGN